ncbi:hypothetical protein CRM22_011142 [Opisthorchis felineus]|uniref:Uncharacterized protein n=1 Tax=Opisthorchis felineus TaxID=147828 RepID=A0A4S2KEE3_OPIFE|nr:hypothetical protein CRM22_011142 [Opisthorchis felineus]
MDSNCFWSTPRRPNSSPFHMHTNVSNVSPQTAGLIRTTAPEIIRSPWQCWSLARNSGVQSHCLHQTRCTPTPRKNNPANAILGTWINTREVPVLDNRVSHHSTCKSL